MNPTREGALFAAALEQPPAQRATFLGNDAQRARVEALLAAFAQAPPSTNFGAFPRLKSLYENWEGSCFRKLQDPMMHTSTQPESCDQAVES